jgi:O-antigen ligase
MAFEHGAPWLIGFFLLSLFSIAASPLFSYPVAYIRLLQLLTPILLYISVSHCGREWTEPVLWCLCLGGCFQAILAITQYFSQEPLGLYALGELKRSYQAGEIPTASGARWAFDHLFGTSTDLSRLRRASGTFNHSNPLSSFLLVAIFSAFTLFKKAPRCLTGAIFLLIFALVLTFSRSAFFAGVIGSLLYFARAKESLHLIRIAAISLLLSCLLLGEQLIQRGGIFNYNEFVEGSDSIRLEQNRVAFQMIKSHPLLGVGYQQFTYTPEYNDFSAKEPITMVHNSLLLAAAESGLFALLCLIAFFASAFKIGWGVERSAFGLAVAVAFCLIANSDFYPLLFQHAKISLFLVLGLMMTERKFLCENLTLNK